MRRISISGFRLPVIWASSEQPSVSFLAKAKDPSGSSLYAMKYEQGSGTDRRPMILSLTCGING